MYKILLIVIGLKLYDGESVKFSDLSDLINMDMGIIFNYIVVSILYTLIVSLGVIILVIPGIYFALKYIFVQYIVIDKNAEPFLALDLSSKLTKDIKLRLLFFGLIIGIIEFVIGMIPIFNVFATLLAAPIITLSYVYIYKTLLAQTNLDQTI